MWTNVSNVKNMVVDWFENVDRKAYTYCWRYLNYVVTVRVNGSVTQVVVIIIISTKTVRKPKLSQKY